MAGKNPHFLLLKSFAVLLHTYQADCRPPDQRFTQWVSEISLFFGHLEFDSPNRHNFRQQLVRAEIDGVRFCRSKGSAISAVRRQIARDFRAYPVGASAAPLVATSAATSGASDLVAATALQPSPFCLVLKLGAGQCVVTQRTDIVLDPGDMMLMRLGDPFRIVHGEESDSMMLVIPDALARQWLESPEDALGRAISGRGGWAAVLSAYLGALDLSQLHAADHEIQRVALVDHVMRLLSVTLAPSLRPEIPDGTTQRMLAKKILYRRMVAWIRESHAESSMSAAKTAQHFQVSMRYVHKLFADVNPSTSFLTTLTTARLQAAASMLKRADGLNIRVADVGFRCGFPDASHFGRVFRERYGCTPRAYMLAAMQSDGTEDFLQEMGALPEIHVAGDARGGTELAARQ